MRRGLFVGLVTLDLIYLADRPPMANEKRVAIDYLVSAGGPATNAAVTFQHLGNEAILLGGLGCHPLAELVRQDLQSYGVTLIDLLPSRTEPPPVSSIVVTQATGERAVISINTAKMPAPSELPLAEMLQLIDLVLIDGHQMQAGAAIAAEARSHGIPVVVDGGSWKPGFDTVLRHTDYAICSANFQPPAVSGAAEVMDFLAAIGVSYTAITQGSGPILYRSPTGSGAIAVPSIQAVDTLGAGDIFHGAFCHALLQSDFVEALTLAAQVATHACQFFGTRQWMHRSP
jgi:sugar/nucleoside kinase (ribokinase family)